VSGGVSYSPSFISREGRGLPELIACDRLIQQQAKALKALINASWLRLYANPLPPDPGNNQSNFTEATFTGYVPAQITTWADPIKVLNGEWQIGGPNVIFRCTSGKSQTVYGWYLTGSPGLFLSSPFTSPVTMFAGSSLGVQLLVTEWATYLLRS
jgi:hypothetical protein